MALKVWMVNVGSIHSNVNIRDNRLGRTARNVLCTNNQENKSFIFRSFSLKNDCPFEKKNQLIFNIFFPNLNKPKIYFQPESKNCTKNVKIISTDKHKLQREFHKAGNDQKVMSNSRKVGYVKPQKRC